MPASARSVTASGERINPRRDSNTMLRLGQQWQQRAFAYYDALGVIKYSAQFYSRMLSPLTLFAGELDKNGDLQPTKNPKVIAELERIQDPGGGRSGLLGSYGRLMFLAGESQLFCSKDPDTELEQWEMLSRNELSVTDSGYQRLRAPALAVEDYREPTEGDFVEKGQAMAFRLWKRHPLYSSLPDSTIQGVLDDCEELLLLTMAIRARARSRLAGAGLLLISDDLTTVPLEPGVDEDPEEDPFLRDLVNAMTAPIADEGSPSSVVPLVVRGSTEAIKDGVKHIQLVDPMQLYPETGLRRECIERIALGLDMPAEQLLGMADSNHWTAWQIDEQTWKGHGQPLAQQLVDDLTAAFLRPTLKTLGIGDWARYAIGYDASAVINHPDRGRDAKDVHKLGALSDKALREATGFEEDDAPSKEERARWVGILVRDGGLAMTGEPSRAALNPGDGPGEDGLDVSDRSGESAGDVRRGPPEEKPQPGERRALPAGDTAATANGNGNGRRLFDAHQLLGAADLGVLRAREAAGARIRSLAKRDDECSQLIEGVAVSLIPATLGHDRVRALQAPGEHELVCGARTLIRDAFIMWKVPAEIAATVADRVEKHAAATLYEMVPTPLPPQFFRWLEGLAKQPAPARS